jgi:hypothetical protein
MIQYTLTLLKQGQPPMKIVVSAQNQQDARRQAESMHPGWHVNSIAGG